MRKGLIVFLLAAGLPLLFSLISCQSNCTDKVLLQTLSFDLEVNVDNLGIAANDTRNSIDTIRSSTNQFYNNPEFRQFGQVFRQPNITWINSAYAQEDCPEVTEYISRFDPSKTMFSLDVDYDGSGLGEGTITAGTDLLTNATLKSNYLMDFETNIFLNGGAPSPLTISKNFFQPINDQWITFYFSFEEIDGTVMTDSARCFIQVPF